MTHKTASIIFFGLVLIQSTYPFSTFAFTFSPRKMDSHRHFQHQRQQLSTMHSSNDPNSHSGKGSIYIPIAPQGAGKTTFLSNLNPITGMDASATNANANANATIGDTIDISIDNQEGVYLPTPIDLFLVNSADHSSPASKHRDILQSRIHNKSISERIYDAANDEMRWVTQRLCNELTQKEFEDKIMAMDRNNATQSVWDKIMQRDGDEDAVDWKQFLVKIVEDNIFVEHDHDYQRLEHVDLFVVECIFKQSKSKDKTKFPLVSAEVENIAWPLHISNQSQSGLMAVSNKLKFLAFDETYHSTSLAWGNTNAKSRDYITALEIAQESGRPVYFIPYANLQQLNIECPENGNQTGTDTGTPFNLPRVGIKALIERNILRFKRSGRFIPTKAIIDTCDRVDMMLSDAVKEMKKSNLKHNKIMYTQFDLDCALASMASFRMNANRTVYKVQNTNFRGGPGGRGRGAGRGRFNRAENANANVNARGNNRNYGNKRNYNYDERESGVSTGGRTRYDNQGVRYNSGRFDRDERGERRERTSARYNQGNGMSQREERSGNNSTRYNQDNGNGPSQQGRGWK